MGWAQRRIIVDGIKLEGDDARYIIRQALSLSPRGGWDWITLAKIAMVFVGLGALCTLTAILARGLWTGRRVTLIMFFTGMIGGVVAMRMSTVFLFRSRRERIRIGMRELGFDLCLKCGFWLKGLDEDGKQCPECGAQRHHPSLSSDTPGDGSAD